MAWGVEGDKCLMVTAGSSCGSNQDPFLSSVFQEIYRTQVETKKLSNKFKGWRSLGGPGSKVAAAAAAICFLVSHLLKSQQPQQELGSDYTGSALHHLQE